jgi:hypothetical protein
MRYGYGRYPRKVLTGTVSRALGWEKKKPKATSSNSEVDGGCVLFMMIAIFIFLAAVLNIG